MKTKSRPQKIENNAIVTFLCSLIILGTTVFFLVGWLNNMTEDTLEDDYGWAATAWEKLSRELYNKRVGVEFRKINTTADDYAKMAALSENLIQQEIFDYEQQNVEIGTKINERTYVDIRSSMYNYSGRSGNISEDKASEYTETGPIYFEDLLITRYINSDGNLTLNATAIKNGEPVEVTSDTITEYVDRLNLEEEAQRTNPNYLSESAYTQKITEIVRAIYAASNRQEAREAGNMAKDYFSLDGRKTIFEGKSVVKLEDGSSLGIPFIKAGSSSRDTLEKDRLFMIQEITVNGKLIRNYTIFKIDDSGYIFDVDII
jgi:hypothetical protein